MDLTAYKRFYFLGIGGIGMSALARYFHASGFAVAGYDKTPSSLTYQLEQEGIAIHFEDNYDLIPSSFVNEENKTTTLIIYTPAIPKDHTEHKRLIAEGFTIRKRAEILAALTMGKKTIAVAGTHGKTSTAAIICHLLATANVPFFGFLGGISTNFNNNFIAPTDGKAELVVVEADEFDRSFHQLNPDVAIVTAVESDHLDIYGTLEKLKEAYTEFAGKLKENGILVLHKSVTMPYPEKGSLLTYGVYNEEETDYTANEIVAKNGRFHFDLHIREKEFNKDIQDVIIGVPGVHNIENALAAIAAIRPFIAATQLEDIVRNGLMSFKGVKRRFELIYESENLAYVDDYAHHPTELKVTIETLRHLYPGRKIAGVFQPHLFTRTRDLAAGFAKSLSLLDELYLMPIYPARELPIEGVNAEMILDKVHAPHKEIIEKEQLISRLALSEATVFLTVGAGDIDRMVAPIKELLVKRNINTSV